MSCENKTIDHLRAYSSILQALDDIKFKISILSGVIGAKSNDEKTKNAELPSIMSTAQVAEQLGNISTDTVRRLINGPDRAKRLPATRCGRGYFIDREVFLKWRDEVYLKNEYS